VSLNDCLACSGCVTSAETVLITAQSSEEFYRHMEKKETIKVITNSPQVITYLAVNHQLADVTMLKKLTSWLKSLGADHVLDSTIGMEIALLEAQKEFVSRFKEKKFPILTSECPGWICYAEKTQGDFILPYISTVKSPQQILGSFVKQFLANKLKKNPDVMFHCTIMPCYDKKLEGARNDFFDSTYQTRDVDVVLTTMEIEDMLKDKKINVSELSLAPLDSYNPINKDGTEMYRPLDTGGSGGYCENIFRYASATLFGTKNEKELKWKTVRTSDFKELNLEVNGTTVLRFAICYGFSNIQNLVRKMKKNQCLYHYVEIMACPAGCLNGGGQIRVAGGIKKQKELVAKLDQQYHAKPIRSGEENPLLKKLYQEWLDSPTSQKILYTTYHAVKNETNGQLIPSALKW